MTEGLKLYAPDGSVVLDSSNTSLSFLGKAVVSANIPQTITVPTYGIISNIKVFRTLRLQIPDNQKALIGSYSIVVGSTTSTITITGNNVDLDVIVLGN